MWWGLLLFVLPTVAFAAISGLLIHERMIGFKGVSANSSGLAYKTSETYLWQLADAVPVLKIPETLTWKPQLKFTTVTGGALVLCYKLLLIFQFAQLAAIMLARAFGDEARSDPADHG